MVEFKLEPPYFFVATQTHFGGFRLILKFNARNKMATVLSGSNDKEKLDDLISRPHKDQAVWFLNAFWEVWSPSRREQSA